MVTGQFTMNVVSYERVNLSNVLSGPTESKRTADDSSIECSLPRLLDDVHLVLASPDATGSNVESAVDQLFRGLRAIRHSSSKDEWQEMIKRGRAHPLRQLVHEDPFTSRAFHKPRGYAGDAVMMDYIYGREEQWQPPQSSHLGAAIFNYTTSAPASAGVRERRCHVADLLDKIAHQKHEQDVLSVAAGHLREVSLSSAVRRNRFTRFVAADADRRSLEEVRRNYGHFGIEPVLANVRQMITGRLEIGSFDLIYTTGLYDYLADSTAKRLTTNLFDHVRPGGRLVIANFLPEIHDVGYMEMYMDWHLVYRSRGQMLMLADDVVQSSVEEIRIFAERNDNVVIMEIVKR